jgi:hypothetical protein
LHGVGEGRRAERGGAVVTVPGVVRDQLRRRIGAEQGRRLPRQWRRGDERRRRKAGTAREAVEVGCVRGGLGRRQTGRRRGQSGAGRRAVRAQVVALRNQLLCLQVQERQILFHFKYNKMIGSKSKQSCLKIWKWAAKFKEIV